MDAVQRFVDAVNRGDAEALGGALAPGATLRSPITARARFERRERIVALYRDVLFGSITQIAVEEIAGDGRVRVLHGTGRAGGATVDEVTVVRLGDDGLIEELTLFVRDLAALAALAAALGPAIAPSRWRSRAIALMTRPIAWLLRRGDRVVVRLAGLA